MSSGETRDHFVSSRLAASPGGFIFLFMKENMGGKQDAATIFFRFDRQSVRTQQPLIIVMRRPVSTFHVRDEIRPPHHGSERTEVPTAPREQKRVYSSFLFL